MIEAGALGCSISGSGPSIFALTKSDEKGNEIGQIIRNEFEAIDVAGEIYCSKINQLGPTILEADEE